MKLINYKDYFRLVERLGGSRPFNSKPREDNYYVYFDHSIELYNFATVNDRCEAPERLYMDVDVAVAVRNELNRGLLRA